MDIKGMLSSEPSDGSQRVKPELQPRLSINNLVNLLDQSPTRDKSVSSNSSNQDIKLRNSIINITNEKDVDIRGNVTPSVARRYSNESPRSSAKKSIKEELDKINQLDESFKQQKNGKPKRYRKPPIWSCDWVPVMKRKGAGPSGPTSRSSSKLAVPSINGVEPSHDMEYAIAGWIYAVLNEIPELERSFLEIELKFGQIFSKEQDERLRLPVNTETVLNLDYFHKNCFFKSGVPPERLDSLKKYLEVTNKKNRYKFIVEKSNQRDTFYTRHERGGKPIKTRVTYDIETNRVVESIDKRRVSDLFIYSPSTHFDLRCSISLEVPLQIGEDELKKLDKNVTLIREKLRTSYIHNQTFTKIDVTNVRKFDQNHGSLKKNPPISSFELELELNSKELWNSFNMLKQDGQYYYDLIKAFLANGRLLGKQLNTV